jgi:hypothetical protein
VRKTLSASILRFVAAEFPSEFPAIFGRRVVGQSTQATDLK